MRKIFVPVLKTKRVSEKNAIKKLLPSFDARNDIIPYLEMIKSFTSRDIETYKKYLGNRRYFAETLIEKEIGDLFSVPSITPVWNVKRNDPLKLSDFITKAHEGKRPIAIRMPDGDTKSWGLSKALLEEGDYLFIDIDTSNFDSSFFLEYIKDTKRPFQIIILSNERSASLTGKALIPYNLKELPKSAVNLSVNEAIKRGEFSFDGFASYCSAKNDLTEEIKQMKIKSVTGYMLVYSFDDNSFSVITSDVSAHISTSYRELLPKIKSNMVSFIDPRFAKTPISKSLIDECVIEGTLSCQKTITIMIVHYIEEIMNNLNVGQVI